MCFYPTGRAIDLVLSAQRADAAAAEVAAKLASSVPESVRSSEERACVRPVEEAYNAPPADEGAPGSTRGGGGW